MKLKNNKIALALTVTFFSAVLFLLSACSDKNKNHDAEPPVVSFTESGEYTVKTGKTVQLSAIVENAVNPSYLWKLNGETLSTNINCTFTGETVGEYFPVFIVDANNGHVEKKVKVSVLPVVLPEISMPGAYAAYSEKEFKIKAKVKNADNASYKWFFNEQLISSADSCIIFTSNTGYQTLALEVSNSEGTVSKSFDVLIIPKSELNPSMYFSDGRYRSPNRSETTVNLSVPLGKSLTLSPVLVNIDEQSIFSWYIDGAVQNTTGRYLNFTPSQKGVHSVSISTETTLGKIEAGITVKCVEPEGTYYRPKVAGNKAGASKAFEYIPAPGQFANFDGYATVEDATVEIQNKLNENSTGWIASLGAYGGYMIVGFDHSVDNVDGLSDLKISGNAFPDSNEPGTVWVMQDENGNGLPDDTWYELKGSETGKPQTRQNYAVTYYKPRTENASVPWTDNCGHTGSVDRNMYHLQTRYFPSFITEKYTLCGTCIALTIIEGNIEKPVSYPWGYVDNYGDGSRPANEFWIEDAVQADGSPANLKYIDFVKVQTAINGKGMVLGELSTETGIPFDMNYVLQ